MVECLWAQNECIAMCISWNTYTYLLVQQIDLSNLSYSMVEAELSTDNISHSISQSRYTTNYSHMQTLNNRMYHIKIKSIPLRKDLAFFDILLMTEKMALNIYNDKEIKVKIFAQSTSLCL